MCSKFWQKLGKSGTETYDIKMAFGEDCMSSTQVFDWFHCFKEGLMSVENLPSSKQDESVIHSFL